MYLIGLTGGIASGKSVVARRLRGHGAVVVDADLVARDVVAPGSAGLAAIRREFGDSVIRPDGSLDRTALAAVVFTDPARRELLNSITHPEVWRESRERFAAAGAADPHAVVVYDVPLLAEGSRHAEFDLVVVVEATADERIRRLVELRSMSETDARSRIAAQASDEERRAIADVVIDSDLSLRRTLEQADDLWHSAQNSALGKQPG